MAITLDGTTGSTQPSVAMTGATSGTVTLTPPAVAGTQSYTLPSAVPAANGYALTSTTGGTMSWASVATSAATPTAQGTVHGFTSSSSPTNAALGYNALAAGSTLVSQTVAIGVGALQSISTQNNCTAVGWNALNLLTGGQLNTAVGVQAGRYLTSGSQNIYIGERAGTSTNQHQTGTGCVYIGPDCGPSSTSVSNEMLICVALTTIGKGANTGFITAGGSGSVYQGNNSASWATTSDRRLKKNIVDNNVGLDVIKSIQVRNFEYRLPEEVDSELKPTDAIPKSGTQLGVIAQELQTVLPECVRSESTGVLRVDSDNLTWYMVNAIKQLAARVEELESK